MKTKHLFIFFIISFSPALLFVFFISPLEYFFLDAKLVISTISYQTYDISDYIAIILIDSKSEQDLSIPIEGKGWRKYDPEIITLLEQNGALVIAFDIEFSGESTQWDEILAIKYRESGNIITCEIIEGSTDPRFRDSVYRIGNASVKNYFGRPRKVNLFPDNTMQKAFSFEVVDAYTTHLEHSTAINPSLLKQRVDKAVSNKEYWINYKYPETYFPLFSYIDLINSKNGRMGNIEKTPLSVFKNRVVLIAKNFQKDKIPLPNNFGNTVFGGLVHAYGIQTILDGSSMRRIPFHIELLILLFLLVCIQIILSRIKGAMSILFVLLLCFIIFIIQVVLFQTMNYWLLYGPLFIEAILSIILYSSYKRYTLGKEFNHINTQVKRLTQFNSQLEETGKLKDILTDTLVHDIKNAIAAIEGSLYFITEKYKEDSQSLEIFHAASIACTDIINLSSNLLDVRKIEEGKLDIVKEACSLEQISGIIERFTNYPLFYEKKINVKINPFDQSLSITLDMYLMEQIIHNLLNNALKYTPVNGKIIITFEQNTDKCTILTFFNSGKPISEDVKETIFEKYKRGKNKRSKYSKGLGLYFCKMAMELQGGRIFLETDAEGNYFRLKF